jgi:hypothetical protein
MKKLIYLFFLIAFILSACQPSSTALQDDVVVSVTSQKAIIPTATATKIPPSITPTFPVATNTITPSQTPTITTTPTASIQFDKVRIFGLENRSDYSLVILEFPELDHVLGLKINNKPYSCVLDEKLANKLLCSGAPLRIKENVNVKFYDEDMVFENLLFEGSIYVPEPYSTPMPLGDPRTWCPLRGTNVFCETEHRVENGEECWVSSSFDACGYYYSYHTCQFPPDNNFLPP